MKIVKRKEYFGDDYCLEEITVEDVLEAIFEQLNFDYFIEKNWEVDLDICLEEFYSTDKFKVIFEDVKLEFDTDIKNISSETIINFLKSKGVKFEKGNK